MYHPITCYDVTLHWVAISWASFNSSSTEFGTPQSLLSMTRRSSLEWDAFGQCDLRPCCDIRFLLLTENLRWCKSRPWIVWTLFCEVWLYCNVQDLMPQSLSQVRRTQCKDILCKWWICASWSSSLHHQPEKPCQTYKFNIDSRGSPSHMTWCITDGVTTSHTISHNAVFEEEELEQIIHMRKC